MDSTYRLGILIYLTHIILLQGPWWTNVNLELFYGSSFKLNNKQDVCQHHRQDFGNLHMRTVAHFVRSIRRGNCHFITAQKEPLAP
jgi:hypothetical protein